MNAYHLQVGEGFFLEMSGRLPKSPGEIVMVIRRPANRVLLMTKDFYPDGIYRLPTGKMKRGEIPALCFAREVREETGFRITDFRSLGVIHYDLCFGGQSVDYPSHVFATQVIPDAPSPEDLDEGISSFQDASTDDLLAVADTLDHMEEPWRDWGRWRALAHRFVHDCLLSLPISG